MVLIEFFLVFLRGDNAILVSCAIHFFLLEKHSLCQRSYVSHNEVHMRSIPCQVVMCSRCADVNMIRLVLEVFRMAAL